MLGQQHLKLNAAQNEWCFLFQKTKSKNSHKPPANSTPYLDLKQITSFLFVLN